MSSDTVKPERSGSMRARSACGVTVFFDAADPASAELVLGACEKSIPLIRACWNLDPPEDVRVYVLTSSWLRATFHSAPWSWRLLMGVTLPLWAFRVAKLWQVAGGWQQQFGRRRVVAVKPPWLLAQGSGQPGDRIFVREDDPCVKVQRITCHELVHAITAHLGLPPWLHEGLALCTVDRFAGKPTIRRETLEVLSRAAAGPRRARRWNPQDLEAITDLYVRGYWRTRYLEETRPGLLPRLLDRRRSHNDLEREIASAYGRECRAFWGEVDEEAAAHFVGRAHETTRTAD